MIKKVWHISDTHGKHDELTIPGNIDLVIHSGDAANNKVPALNVNEIEKFISWYAALDIPHKIFVPGNHDTCIEAYAYMRDYVKEHGIHLLIHEELELEGLKIFGSPYTPTFGEWSFMKSRNTIGRIWEQIPENLDFLITHGPPKYILDLTENKFHNLEACGDSSLVKAIVKRDIKYHLFGHIHNYKEITNAGIRLSTLCMHTTFCNGAVVEDGNFKGSLVFNGNVINV